MAKCRFVHRMLRFPLPLVLCIFVVCVWLFLIFPSFFSFFFTFFKQNSQNCQSFGTSLSGSCFCSCLCRSRGLGSRLVSHWFCVVDHCSVWPHFLSLFHSKHSQQPAKAKRIAWSFRIRAGTCVGTSRRVSLGH